MKGTRLGGLALGAALLFTSGCYDIEQLIKLNPDLSGEASLRIAVDMEAMIKIMASMEKKFSGKEGEPTKEELEKARQEFLEKNKADKEKDQAEFEAKKKKLEEKLPQGVTLKGIEMKDEGLKLEVSMTFGFDHVAKLKEIEFPADEGEEEGGPAGGQPLERPFEGLVVEETGDTIRIKAKPANPAKDKEEAKGEGEGEEGMGEGEEGGPGEMEGMKELVKSALGSLKVAYKIESPLQVVKHNATAQKGNLLEWSYDLARLEKLEQEKGELPDEIDVTFKKQ